MISPCRDLILGSHSSVMRSATTRLQHTRRRRPQEGNSSILSLSFSLSTLLALLWPARCSSSSLPLVSASSKNGRSSTFARFTHYSLYRSYLSHQETTHTRYAKSKLLIRRSQLNWSDYYFRFDVCHWNHHDYNIEIKIKSVCRLKKMSAVNSVDEMSRLSVTGLSTAKKYHHLHNQLSMSWRRLPSIESRLSKVIASPLDSRSNQFNWESSSGLSCPQPFQTVNE